MHINLDAVTSPAAAIPMLNYITAITFHASGGPPTHRNRAFKTAARKAGVKVSQVFWSFGEREGAIVFEARNDDAADMLMLSLAGVGQVHSETLREIYAADFFMIAGAS